MPTDDLAEQIRKTLASDPPIECIVEPRRLDGRIFSSVSTAAAIELLNSGRMEAGMHEMPFDLRQLPVYDWEKLKSLSLERVIAMVRNGQLGAPEGDMD